MIYLTRKPRDVAAVCFSLKFANIHEKFESTATKLRWKPCFTAPDTAAQKTDCNVSYHSWSLKFT